MMRWCETQEFLVLVKLFCPVHNMSLLMYNGPNHMSTDPSDVTCWRGGGVTREGFLRKNIVAVLFIQNCAIHPYS